MSTSSFDPAGDLVRSCLTDAIEENWTVGGSLDELFPQEMIKDASWDDGFITAMYELSEKSKDRFKTAAALLSFVWTQRVALQELRDTNGPTFLTQKDINLATALLDDLKYALKSFGVRAPEQLFIDRLRPEENSPEFLQWLVPLISELRNLSELRTRLTYQDFVEQFAIEFDKKAELSDGVTAKRYIDMFDLRNAYDALKEEHGIVHEPRVQVQELLETGRITSRTSNGQQNLAGWHAQAEEQSQPTTVFSMNISSLLNSGPKGSNAHAEAALPLQRYLEDQTVPDDDIRSHSSHTLNGDSKRFDDCQHLASQSETVPGSPRPTNLTAASNVSPRASNFGHVALPPFRIPGSIPQPRPNEPYLPPVNAPTRPSGQTRKALAKSRPSARGTPYPTRQSGSMRPSRRDRLSIRYSEIGEEYHIDQDEDDLTFGKTQELPGHLSAEQRRELYQRQMDMAETKRKMLYDDGFFLGVQQELEFKKRLEEFGG